MWADTWGMSRSLASRDCEHVAICLRDVLCGGGRGAYGEGEDYPGERNSMWCSCLEEAQYFIRTKIYFLEIKSYRGYRLV